MGDSSVKLVVTGGAGFIGSAFIRRMLAVHHEVEILNIDKLSYAGNLDNLKSVEGHPRYRFERVDICDSNAIDTLFQEFQPAGVVHFAAETHVDRSILSPAVTVNTNVTGTLVLLEAARALGAKLHRFVHVSTDEVYGTLDEPIHADETFPLLPSSPYSASKAGSDLLALSYHRTFEVPVVVTRASNNYGPYQFPEKLIPLMTCRAMESASLPVYGDGRQSREWLHVDDHCDALWAVLTKGRVGEIYNIGTAKSVTNLEVVQRILDAVGADRALIQHVTDRPAHDRRYALACEKIQAETGWAPTHSFETGLRETVEWYRSNPDWLDRVRSGEYRDYYAMNYAGRSAIRP